ncbi:MAG: metallophosphoesterase [bacterium]|nr:metallophosphoesterase [bacterium]
MKIGVVSDTHGQLRAVQAALARVGPLDLLLHAGDHYQDGFRLGQALKVTTKAVVGNCDLMVAGPEEEMLRLKGRRILLTHGHLYRVKRTYQLLINRAVELAADIVVFGHTHLPVSFRDGGVLFLNPGSPVAGAGRDVRRTYAILHLQPIPRVDIIPLEPARAKKG